jgi:hypothetical protein
MNARTHKNRGLTLMETTIVVGTIALMVGFGLPAVRSLTRSFQTEGATRGMIEAALGSARTLAMSRQRYVGLRFQKRCISEDPANPLKGIVDAPQYMIFIMYNPKPGGTGLANGFSTMVGMEPIKLPEAVGVMPSKEGQISSAFAFSKRDNQLNNATTFSVVFSPSGRLVSHAVRVRNRDGVYQPNNGNSSKVSHDDVFNSVDNICTYKEGMFIQDDYSPSNDTGGSPNTEVDLGLGEESSMTEFVLYDTAKFRALYSGSSDPRNLMNYLNELAAKPVYVNSYTGQLISAQ